MLRKDDDDWVRGVMEFEEEGVRKRRRPRLKWSQVTEKDMKDVGLQRKLQETVKKWRKLSHSVASQPLHKQGEQLQNARKMNI